MHIQILEELDVLSVDISCVYHCRACLILRVFALSRRVLARLRRAKNGVCGVEQALRSCSTPHTPSSERDGNHTILVKKTYNKRLFHRKGPDNVNYRFRLRHTHLGVWYVPWFCLWRRNWTDHWTNHLRISRGSGYLWVWRKAAGSKFNMGKRPGRSLASAYW